MRKLALLLFLILTGSIPVHPQGPSDPTRGRTIDTATRQKVIEGAIKAVNENYIFPEVAKKMEAALAERMRGKEYDNITDAFAFASLLTRHLQEVSHDKHLRVYFTGGGGPIPGGGPDPASNRRYREMATIDGHPNRSAGSIEKGRAVAVVFDRSQSESPVCNCRYSGAADLASGGIR